MSMTKLIAAGGVSPLMADGQSSSEKVGRLVSRFWPAPVGLRPFGVRPCLRWASQGEAAAGSSGPEACGGQRL